MAPVGSGSSKNRKSTALTRSESSELKYTSLLVRMAA